MSDGSILDAAAQDAVTELRELTGAVRDGIDWLEQALADGRGPRRDRWVGEFFVVLLAARIGERGDSENLKVEYLERVADQAWQFADLLDRRDPALLAIGVAAADPAQIAGSQG